MSFTPYAAAKIVNNALVENEIDKVIPTQMMYNYTTARIRQGKAPFIECDKEGRITEEGLQKWLVKYLTKQGVEVK